MITEIINEFGYSFDYPIEPVKSQNLKIVKMRDKATLYYDTLPNLCFLLTRLYAMTETEGEESFPALSIKDAGVMFDNSRHASLSLNGAKNIVRELAKLGYTYVEMYNEDNYEVDGEPYFGYLRGKWTKEEFRDLDEYCSIFGMEVVPCIQTLAHLSHIFRWEDYKGINDCNDILLIGEERTYQLIENIVKTYRECVRSNRINIGMDEADMAGLGKYLKEHGFTDRRKMLLEHLGRIRAICEKYHFKSEMWSDMFFRLQFGEYYVDRKDMSFIDKKEIENTRLIYWDYYSEEEDQYLNMIDNHTDITCDVSLAVGCWKWMGYAPLNKYTEKVAVPAMSAANKRGIKDVLVCAWGDNGGETSVFSVLPAFAFYSSLRYNRTVDYKSLSQLCEKLWGYDYEEFCSLDTPNRLCEPTDISSPCKYLLFNDSLYGVMNDYMPEHTGELYRQKAESLEKSEKKNSPYAYLFTTMKDLCRLLSQKAELSVNIQNAYNNKDRESLKKIADQVIPEIIVQLKQFISSFTNQFVKENRRCGLEQDIARLGGVLLRLQYTSDVIGEYLSGKLLRIEELEEKRLEIFQGKKGRTVAFNNYMESMSVN